MFIPHATAAERFFEFFTTKIRNPHAAGGPVVGPPRLGVLQGAGAARSRRRQSLYVAAYIEWLALPGPAGRGLSGIR
jgi:hypothetical protein